MAINIETGLAVVQRFVNNCSYSMYGSRYYTDGTCDCSGSVYRILRESGGFDYGYIPSTETLHDYLTKLGYEKIAENSDFPMQRGDIIIWGQKGYSAGAGGHTGIALDNQNWIECTGWKDTTIIANHDQRWVMAGCPYFYAYRLKSTPKPNPSPAPAPKPQPSGNKNGIAIDNVTKDQAVKMVQRIQTKYAWTLLRDQVKRVLQPNKVYTLVITCDSKWKYENAVNRLKQELKTYYPGYMQQNIAIVDGDKPIIKIEARNLNDEQSKKMEGHMRNFLKDVLLDQQTYAEANSYGTYDVRVKGEGFNNTDAPIVLKEIQEMGKAKDVGINPAHIKGFKY
ncbi:peptidoglycan amidohydrolase family protein [Enterococcus hulanensis]|uniref:Peptidoglycan amidohydrolase family protein n=1 Tax=Enterococcus hulanensis TaxID=2559929 RepID=A0ABU3F0Z6_9ENTE|nr:peptidoglycan amidohydrolase family protein [Enterococcus hulanensis]MDT2600804.1 peptidoglycan amidohydrolase family protein [Enterococcus hulanensis]MDT2610327.1 peptidoglycan amidohydrolase family protein [Enterococcus hulanensis]MDT2617265.1 peptidoglycan amidohydrolase family protein [Enterococcus hulanensis]